MTIAPAHTAQCEAAMAANRSFVATWFPFEGRSIKACEVRCSRDNKSDKKRGDNDRRDEPAYNSVALLPARGTASFSHLAIAADGAALTSEKFVMHEYGYDNEE